MSSVGIAGVVIVVPLILLLVVAVPIIIGVYVYRDAKSRHMNALLWMIVAVIAPTFIGLIVYLLARNEHEVYSCPSCRGPVQPEFAMCPRCGIPLKSRCRNCNMLLEEDWKICPSCGEPISEEERISRPIKKISEDNKIVKLLAIVIIIPIVLCIFLIIGVFMYRFSTKGSDWSSTSNSSMEYIILENSQMNQWIINE